MTGLSLFPGILHPLQQEPHSMKFLLAVYMYVVIKDDYDLILWLRS